MKQYDAGLLNDYGGGDVAWWHDYIRSLLDSAEAHYQEQCADQLEFARLLAAMPAPLMLRPMAAGGYIIAVAQTCVAKYSADTAIAVLQAAEEKDWDY
jgi:hypothetical protein